MRIRTSIPGLLAELEQADEYVIGVPMHNFGVPSVLKLWIDQIAPVGRTFSYGDERPKGLIIGKKATFILATGGIYDAQTQMACQRFLEVALYMPDKSHQSGTWRQGGSDFFQPELLPHAIREGLSAATIRNVMANLPGAKKIRRLFRAS